MLRQVCASLLSVSFLAGCFVVAPTEYQPSGFTGGFEETQLSDNTWRINFAGNAHTSQARAQDFALLRSSELALANGYRYFVITDQASWSKQRISKTGGKPTTTTSVTGVTTTKYSPTQVHTYNNPQAENVIVCFKEKPEIDGMIFDAEFLQKTLRQKYSL